MRYAPLLVALALSLAASTAVAADLPTGPSLLAVGAFLLFTPGLVATHLLALPDRLLALVVGLLVGPSLWVLVATVQLFAGLWAPRPTILVASGLFGVLTLVLALRGVRREVAPPEPEPAGGAGRVEQYSADELD